MRPHLLELEAFGAFPGRVELDLDEIGQAGLVLLCGDTGGGKTTLLDALGFALYGVVPGERQKARDDLRSHHAPATATAFVRLTFTARGRRLRVSRTPAQTRPKKRGAGVLVENPTALLESWEGRRWLPLAQRLDDVGHEIGLLLGMDASQFFQVVVLPQGRFAAFLQADHKDREKLLKQLFHVDRFERAEQWLADRAVLALGRVAGAAEQLHRLGARLGQEAGVEPPTDLEAEPGWAGALAGAAEQQRSVAAARTAELLGRRTAAEAALAEAELLAARQVARRAADQELAALEEQAGEVASLLAERDAAERARPVQVALDAETLALATVGDRLAGAHAARASLAAQLSLTACPAGALSSWSAQGDDVALRALADLLLTEGGRLASLVEVAERVEQEWASAASLTLTAERLEGQLDRVRTLLQQVPTRRQRVLDAQAAGLAAGQTLPAARVIHEAAVTQAALRTACEAAGADVEQAAMAAARTEAESDRLRDVARQVRNDRVDALIGRLAGALVDDTPCPVCGSLSHPDVSELTDDDVGEVAEQQAEAAAEHAAAAAAAAAGELARREERLDGLRGRLVADPPDPTALSAMAVELCRLEALAAAVPPSAVLTELQADVERWTGELARLETLAAEARKRSAEAGAQAVELHDRLVTELGQGVDLAERQAKVATAARAAAATADALTELSTARRAAAAATTTAVALLDAAGFAEAAAACAAARPPGWSTAAAAQLDAHREQLAGVRARLVELDVPLNPPAPVAERTAVARGVAAAHEDALAGERILSERATALLALVPVYVTTVAALGPLRAQATELKGLADVTAGRGSNRLSMPLSTYVLAARLEEVAEAAGRRLSRMSGGRYTLSHTDVGRDRRSRAGLGLQVDDGWTGRSRDTATLSGGETFMTALSLALGLADVVTAESGGRSIDALFVDEGFGTLDAGSLDQVMDVLDELRSGGRLVGVVSHVADLRQRIPAQIHVVKGESGSTVELR